MGLAVFARWPLEVLLGAPAFPAHRAVFHVLAIEQCYRIQLVDAHPFRVGGPAAKWAFHILIGGVVPVLLSAYQMHIKLRHQAAAAAAVLEDGALESRCVPGLVCPVLSSRDRPDRSFNPNSCAACWRMPRVRRTAATAAASMCGWGPRSNTGTSALRTSPWRSSSR